MKNNSVLISCEHGGNRIPAPYRKVFEPFQSLLQSHRGYDAGALKMAQDLATALNAPLYYSTVSRLLIDLNRRVGHPNLYSEATKVLPPALKQAILEQHYLPYRKAVQDHISQSIQRRRRIVHISSHSFTPELKGQVRNADIGLLYDPSREYEALLCREWKSALKAQVPGLRIRMNYPYAGTADGFTAALRRQYPSLSYAGIELEINQRHLEVDNRHWQALRSIIVETFREVI